MEGYLIFYLMTVFMFGFVALEKKQDLKKKLRKFGWNSEITAHDMELQTNERF